MPSVRVKRGQYTYLLDEPQDDSLRPTRRRSRSVAGIFNSSSAPPQPAPLTESPRGHGRRRSQTVYTSRDTNDAPGSPPPRQPSWVVGSIMGSTRGPRRGSTARRRRDPSQNVGYTGPQEEGERGAEDDRNMVSLHGSQENVVYRGQGTHPGRIGSALSLPNSEDSSYDLNEDAHHHDDIVEHLDVIDPQVATVSTLTDAANTIVFPPLSFYSRKPVIVLNDVRRRPSNAGEVEKGQTDEDDLDRHVEDVLRKRDQFRRIMRGVWMFMKTPMGIIVSIYGFLIVIWGAGIVLFLAKMINLHNSNTQGFWVELCQQIETGLFTATSIGLIPFRALDTWRISRIWHYQRVTIKRRQQAGVPLLYDNNDLPDPYYDRNYIRVLTDQEQEDLHYQQHKFMQSMTWYRPHGTFTHRAFPISLALWICILNDLNSFFQILLSACMWSMDRFQRPAWTTATTLPAAFVVGILAGVLIWQGGKKTRRHEQVEARLRAALAMERPAAKGSAPEYDIDGPRTSDTTPTLPVHAPSMRCEDYGQYRDEEDVTKGKGVERQHGAWWEVDGSGQDIANAKAVGAVDYQESPTPPANWRTRRQSSYGVAIADHMTVPPADVLYPPSVPLR